MTNRDYIAYVCDIFKRQNSDLEIIYVELVTSQAVRLERNLTENRLKNKASKRKTDESKERLIGDDERYRCVSNDGEVTFENYIKIDNTNLSASAAAEIIKERFCL